MKKILLILAVFFGIGQAYADNKLVVGETTIPKGLTGTIDIELQNDVEFTAFTMKLTLPEGLSFVLNEKGKVSFDEGSRFDDHALSVSDVTDNSVIFACLSASSAPIESTSGTLISVYVKSDASLEIGTKLTATITEPTFTTPGEVEYNLSAVNIPVTIGEPRTLLDENSTTVPEASSGAVDVRVKRTINANEWSTICLPFAMSAEQVTAAFGNDVQLADFTGWATTEWNVDNDPTAISVSFANVSAIEANKPYIIKVSTTLSEFTVDGVDIDPDDEPIVTVGKKSKGTFGSFTGSYVPMTIDEECLFISNNKFWYSTGKTKMKGYRAYFYFQDVLAEAEPSPVKMFVFVDDEETKVEGISTPRSDEIIYDLNGRKVTRPQQHGVYIVNGKKVLK